MFFNQICPRFRSINVEQNRIVIKDIINFGTREEWLNKKARKRYLDNKVQKT